MQSRDARVPDEAKQHRLDERSLSGGAHLRIPTSSPRYVRVAVASNAPIASTPMAALSIHMAIIPVAGEIRLYTGQFVTGVRDRVSDLE